MNKYLMMFVDGLELAVVLAAGGWLVYGMRDVLVTGGVL